MQLFSKRKIEIIVELPANRLVVDILDRHGVSGYTVLPAQSGRGHTGHWDAQPVTAARQQVMVVIVVDESLVEPILADVRRLFADFHGILFLSSVDVMRAERF
jgi:nitrogen regulatory protein PII